MKKVNFITFIVITINILYWGITLSIKDDEIECVENIEIDSKVIEADDVVEVIEVDEWIIMGLAIQKVESEFDSLAYRPDTQAAGLYQQRPIYVRDANRIVGEDRFVLEDRFIPAKAQEMFDIVQGYYNPDKDILYAINIHIKGEIGHKKHPNKHQWYVNRVLNAMDEIRDEIQ